mgnify:CR=1 FL=1
MSLNMTFKIQVVVDLDDDLELTEHGSLDQGVSGRVRVASRNGGVYHMYYGSKSYLVTFSPPKSCEYCSHDTCDCEKIIDDNIQAQERTGQQ